MPTIIMPNTVYNIPNPYMFVDVDPATANRKTIRYLSGATVKEINCGLNEQIATATLELPNAKFGEHINFGCRIEIFVNNRYNKIFDGNILKETSKLDESSDTVSVVAYGPRWKLNTQTIAGTYDARWNDINYAEANRIVGIKKVLNVTQTGVNNWNNLTNKTIFNENGYPDMQVVAAGENDAGVPLFDKNSPHKDRPQRIAEKTTNHSKVIRYWVDIWRRGPAGNRWDFTTYKRLITDTKSWTTSVSEREDNPFYPKQWTLGYIIKYLIFFHKGDYDFRILNRDVVKLNTLPTPRHLDVQGLGLIQAITKVIRQAGDQYAFDIETVGRGDDTYYRFVLINHDESTEREIKIARPGSFVQGQHQLNVNSATINRDAREVITSLRGLGRKIQLETTIKLEPAWNVDEVKQYFPIITDTQIKEIFLQKYCLNMPYNILDVKNLDKSVTPNLPRGNNKLLSDNTSTYFDVYTKCQDFFDKRYYRVWKLPSDVLTYRATIDENLTYRGLELKDLFISDENNEFRKIEPPVTLKSATDLNVLTDETNAVVDSTPNSRYKKYDSPIVYVYDGNLDILSVVANDIHYEYETILHFESGIPWSPKYTNKELKTSKVTFSIDKNTIVFSEPQIELQDIATLKSMSNKAQAKYISKNKEDKVQLPVTIAQLLPRYIFMTAVIDTDARMSPLAIQGFSDFTQAGISVNRYIENNDFKTVIRNHSILLHQVELRKNNTGSIITYDPIKDEDHTSGFPKYNTNKLTNESIVENGEAVERDSQTTRRLRVRANSQGKLEDFTDPLDDGEVIAAFIDDIDNFMDYVTGKLADRASFKEDGSFTLKNFDVSYKPGERIRNIVNSDVYGTGFKDRNLIITSVQHQCVGSFETTLNVSSLQKE